MGLKKTVLRVWKCFKGLKGFKSLKGFNGLKGFKGLKDSKFVKLLRVRCPGLGNLTILSPVAQTSL